VVTLVLGAGFSRWARGLPLARELFDWQVEAWDDRENGKLTRLKA